jgi:hypothetical protein
MLANKPIPIDMTQVVKSNFDLSERLFNDGVSLSYDEDGDTLLITIGEPKNSISKPFFDGIYIQIEPTSYKITGCTILAFMSDFLGKNKLIRKLFPNALEQFRDSEGTVQLFGADAERTRLLFETAIGLK